MFRLQIHIAGMLLVFLYKFYYRLCPDKICNKIYNIYNIKE